MTGLRGADWRWLLLPGAIVFGALMGISPPLGAALALLAFLAGLALTWFDQLPAAWGWALGVSLLGYAVLGRGYAYLGAPPIFVGEVLLLVGALLALTHGRWRKPLQEPLVWSVLAYMGWGAAQTVPYLATYRIDALRDAVLWGYAAFALITVTLVTTRSAVARIVRTYARFVPWVLILAPAGLVATHLIAPRIPLVPGTDVPMADLKPGDLAVHLVGVLGFLVLGQDRHAARHEGQPSRALGAWPWAWSLLWLGAWLTTFTARAAIVTVIVGAAVLTALRPTSGWWRPAYLGAVLLVLAVAFDVSLQLSDRREISAESLAITAVSLVDNVERADYGGTRTWRLNWWNDIVDYTVFGPHRWTGKGYGVNLANDDGYQVHGDDSLRSPHNAHLNVLARGGVPGALLWATLHLSLLAALFVAYLRRRAEGRDGWARLDLWLLAYLIAFHVNASFDVFLEGPQGGIWFWTLVGFALAALRIQHPESGARTRHDLPAPERP